MNPPPQSTNPPSRIHRRKAQKIWSSKERDEVPDGGGVLVEWEKNRRVKRCRFVWVFRRRKQRGNLRQLLEFQTSLLHSVAQLRFCAGSSPFYSGSIRRWSFLARLVVLDLSHSGLVRSWSSLGSSLPSSWYSLTRYSSSWSLSARDALNLQKFGFGNLGIWELGIFEWMRLGFFFFTVVVCVNRV